MRSMRRNHDSAFKAKVALEAVKAEKTLAQLSSECGVHPNQIRKCRKHLLQELPGLFSGHRKKAETEREELESELYKQIGQLKVELDRKLWKSTRWDMRSKQETQRSKSDAMPTEERSPKN